MSNNIINDSKIDGPEVVYKEGVGRAETLLQKAAQAYASGQTEELDFLLEVLFGKMGGHELEDCESIAKAELKKIADEYNDMVALFKERGYPRPVLLMEEEIEGKGDFNEGKREFVGFRSLLFTVHRLLNELQIDVITLDAYGDVANVRVRQLKDQRWEMKEQIASLFNLLDQKINPQGVNNAAAVVSEIDYNFNFHELYLRVADYGALINLSLRYSEYLRLLELQVNIYCTIDGSVRGDPQKYLRALEKEINDLRTRIFDQVQELASEKFS